MNVWFWVVPSLAVSWDFRAVIIFALLNIITTRKSLILGRTARTQTTCCLTTTFRALKIKIFSFYNFGKKLCNFLKLRKFYFRFANLNFVDKTSPGIGFSQLLSFPTSLFEQNRARDITNDNFGGLWINCLKIFSLCININFIPFSRNQAKVS